ncbi:hypothetical protein K0M31_007587 [Melipona bicolor]|uniref:Uncharacterized protein n=1 Tax=Melipona bicolor TaxID=60889 RepID=A0AA40GBZ7_9HYME|nr:hypothetical protein K0M31_007587 [Melipona bicolor]
MKNRYQERKGVTSSRVEAKLGARQKSPRDPRTSSKLSIRVDGNLSEGTRRESLDTE